MVGLLRASLLGMALGAVIAPSVLVSSARAADAAIEVGAGQAVLVTLDRAARQVVVGDPSVADVSVESPRRVIVFGKRTGSTSLLVLDGGRRTVLDVPVVVQAGGAGAVTVTYGAGKEVKPGGLTAVFACGATCVRASDKPAGGGSDGGKK